MKPFIPTFFKMSQKEIQRHEIILECTKGRMTELEASDVLGVGVRQIQRLKALFRKLGLPGLVNKSRGRVSNRKHSESFKETVKKICFLDQYLDFNNTHLSEKLHDLHDLIISHETLRKRRSERGIHKPRKRGAVKRQFMMRKRKECLGEMVQFDGCYHHRCENRNNEERCLLLGVDDATGSILHAQFTYNEGRKAVFQFRYDYIKKYGRPMSIYLDRFATYKVNHPQSAEDEQIITQFERVCQDLGITLIKANSPQAKGRVEKYNSTMQDRLIKEMRLLDICDMDSANKYLQEKFIQDYNQRFAIKPAQDENKHKPLHENHRLELIFCYQEIRCLRNDYTVSYKTQIFQLLKEDKKIYPKISILVLQSPTGEISFMKNGCLINHNLVMNSTKEKLHKEKKHKFLSQEIKDKNLRQDYRIQMKQKKYELQQKERGMLAHSPA